MYHSKKLGTPAASLEIHVEGECFSGAFAVYAKEVGRALAHPTVVGLPRFPLLWGEEAALAE